MASADASTHGAWPRPARRPRPGRREHRGRPATRPERLGEGQPELRARAHPSEVGRHRTGAAGERVDSRGDGAPAAELGCDLLECTRQTGGERAARGGNERGPAPAGPAASIPRTPNPARTGDSAAARSVTAAPAMHQYSTASSGVHGRSASCSATTKRARRRSGTRHRDRGPSNRARSATAARRPAAINPAHVSGPTTTSTRVSTAGRTSGPRARSMSSTRAAS